MLNRILAVAVMTVIFLAVSGEQGMAAEPSGQKQLTAEEARAQIPFCAICPSCP